MDNYDNTKEDVFIEYLDAIDLYGWAMNQPLPMKIFLWDKAKTLNDLLEIDPFGKVGYIIECDIDYPTTKRRKHADYLLVITHKQLDTTTKLISSVENQKNYICHLRNLQFYVKQGLKVSKIHKVLSFTQAGWMGSYNLEKTERTIKNGKDPIKKDFYKLLNNSVSGTILENVRNKINFKVVSDGNGLKKYERNM